MYAVEKHNVIKHCRNNLMLMQMRMISKQVLKTKLDLVGRKGMI